MQGVFITGWSILFLDTLTGLYDKKSTHMKKIVVDICSVYQGISFGNKKSENITEISFDNRNNRNYKNNRNILEKMFKMDSFCIGHKACLLFCYLRHILLQNVVTNIDKFKKTVKFCESPDYEVKPSLCSHGLKVKNAIL